MDFIIQNIEIILLAVAGVVGFFLLGKKKALILAEKVLYDVRDAIGDNIIANQDKYTNAVYAKLPLKAKVFVTKAMIKKIVVELAQFIDVDEEDTLTKK